MIGEEQRERDDWRGAEREMIGEEQGERDDGRGAERER